MFIVYSTFVNEVGNFIDEVIVRLTPGLNCRKLDLYNIVGLSEAPTFLVYGLRSPIFSGPAS